MPKKAGPHGSRRYASASAGRVVPMLVLAALGACTYRVGEPRVEKPPVARWRNEVQAPAPWQKLEVIPASSVARVHIRAWRDSEQKGVCPLLLPTDMRGKAFAGPDTHAWAIWFRTPDRLVIEARERASSIVATGAFPNRRTVKSWRWDDRVSEAHFFAITGGGAVVIILIDGLDCGYKITDDVGMAHAERLIDSLRFVEGTTEER